MKCLDIPVDHRLLPIIQQMKIPPSEQPSSHLTILNNFAENHPTGTPIPSSEIHHGLELAGPDRKGGVLVTLLQPPRTQTYENGYPADLASCPTTKAVNELIATATNHQLSIDEVCAFDRLPYVHGGFNNDDDEVIQEAERTFEDMVRTKEPQVVLCCYGQKSSLMRGEITWGLYGQGVGEVFKVPEFAISSDCTTKRVNAFHPSYAVNYYTSYSCFRRLLLLEFVQAFCLLVGPWKEEQWMRDLRSECSSLGKRLYKEKKPGQQPSPQHRWEHIMDSLTQALSNMNYFRIDFNSNDLHDRLQRSNLSWHCADAYLYLSKYRTPRDKKKRPFASVSLPQFRTWCTQACKPDKLNQTSRHGDKDARGYFDGQCLSSTRIKLLHSDASRLQEIFFSFLRDINLSFWGTADRCEVSIQRDAFLRFSDRLERAASHLGGLSYAMGRLHIEETEC